MGWTSIPCHTRPAAAELNEMVKEWMQSDDCRIIDRSGWQNHGRHQFLLMETRPRNQETESRRFIILILVEHSRHELFYKDVEESMGPLAYDCPMRLINQLEGHPPLGEFSAKWRDKVLAYHRENNPRTAILRKLRKEYPNGEQRVVLRSGTTARYDQGTYRRRRNVSAYWDKGDATLHLLKPDLIDADATTKLWATGQRSPDLPETKVPAEALP